MAFALKSNITAQFTVRNYFCVRCLGWGVMWGRPALKNANFRNAVQSLLKLNSQVVHSTLIPYPHNGVSYTNRPLKIWHNSRWNRTMKCARWYFQGGSDHICNVWAGISAAEYQGPGGSGVRRERRRSTHTSHPRPPNSRSMLGPHAHTWAPPQWLESRCWRLNRDFSFTLETTETRLHILLVHPMGSIHQLIFCFIHLRNSYPYFFGGGCDMKYPCQLNSLLSMKESQKILGCQWDPN